MAVPVIAATGTSPRAPPWSPIWAAIAWAVAAWSPVIIFTAMPASWQAATAATASGRGGSIIACRPNSDSSSPRSGESKCSEPVGAVPRAMASTRSPPAPSASACARTCSRFRSVAVPSAAISQEHIAMTRSVAPLT